MIIFYIIQLQAIKYTLLLVYKACKYFFLVVKTVIFFISRRRKENPRTRHRKSKTILARWEGVIMKREFRDYQDKLIQDLQDPELASAYLNEALKDEDPRIFLLALKNVCEAQGEAMADLARRTKISRENLYRILSKRGNPKLNNVVSLLSAVGFQLSVSPYRK